ncbi:MAG: NrsF family protein [Burkholderiaceae bacterium]
MKTDDLIAVLARELQPVDPRVPLRAFALAIAAGIAAELTLLHTSLARELLLPAYLAQPMFWVKFAFGALLALSSLWAALRLGRPGMPLSVAGVLPFVPLAAVWLLAAIALATAAPDQREALVWGQTWSTCPPTIALLSLPALAGALLALRKMAPTRPAWAGAAAGALAGGLGAAAYALQCPELAAPFIGVWYVIGIAAVVAIGAVAGRYVLRW